MADGLSRGLISSLPDARCQEFRLLRSVRTWLRPYPFRRLFNDTSRRAIARGGRETYSPGPNSAAACLLQTRPKEKQV
jgi:hypothetical protein